MMVSKTKYANGDGDEDGSEFLHSGRLLEDIEAIGRALHLHLSPESALISPLKSVNRFSDSFPGSNTIQMRTAHLGDSYHERQRYENSPKKTLWNWKNSLKSLVRVAHKKVCVSFFLHVHSVEGLPSMFNYGSLSVNWKKHDRISQTLPSLVSQGTAKFDETLALRCTVYGRSGALHVAKYEPKISLINVVVLDEPHLDTGKHWVDLTRLLPLTLRELAGELSKRSWSTTFALSGKANGATLNVSFSYSVHLEDHFDSATTSSEGDPRVSSVNSVVSTGKQDEEVALSVLRMKLDDWDVSSVETRMKDDETADVADFDDLMFTVAQQWMSRADERKQMPEDDKSVVEVIDVAELFSEDNDDKSSQDKPCSASQVSSLESDGVKAMNDVSELVTNEFLKFLGENEDVDDLLSPRKPRQFEDDAEASVMFFEHWEETSDLNTITKHSCDEFDFRSQLKIMTQNTGITNVVEDLESEELLREWGLSDKSFQKSPCRSPHGFGSPIELFPEDPVALPQLGEGIKPFAAVKSGGFLQSMKPCLFTQSKTSSSLIIQVSRPVVLPSALGSEFLDIAQHLGSAGADKLSLVTNTLMPMEDMKGKTLLQVVDADFSRDPNYEWGFHYVTLEDIIPLMIDKISDLLIEGLRVQSGVSETCNGPIIHPRRVGTNSSSRGSGLSLHDFLVLEKGAELEMPCLRENTCGLEELFSHCIPLEEWVRLDLGIIGGGDAHGNGLSSILSAHNGRERSDGHGLFEGKIAVSLKVQLRDPVRDYEPVGAPMLAVVRLERKFIRRLLLPYLESEDFGTITDENGEWCPCFKILETHLSGVRVMSDKTTPWSTRTQLVSGTRWLVGNGMTKSNSTTNCQSQAIVVSRSPMKTDCLWSLSLHSSVKDWFRNPNIILN